MPKSIDDLHTDLHLEVASHLTPEEIVKKLSVLNKKYNQISNLQLLWKLKTKTHFPQAFRIHAKRKNVNWKALFIKNYKENYPRSPQRDFTSVKAAKEGRLDVLKSRGYDDETLTWAAYNKHQHLLDYFYRCWFDYGNKNLWLSHAIKCNQPLKTIEEIINQGANLKLTLNSFGPHYAVGSNSFPLHDAAKVGNVEIIKILLDHGANINATNLQQKSPLVLAIEQNHFEVVKFLLDQGAALKCPIQTYDYGSRNLTQFDFEFPLYTAFMQANKNIVDLLLTKGASLPDLLKQVNFSISQSGQQINPNTLLHEVVQQNEIELAEFLLKHVDINTNVGNTPLMIACLEGHEEMVEMLLANGADFAIPGHDYLDRSPSSDPIGYYMHRVPVKLSPLFVGVKYGHQAITQALLKKGVDIAEAAQASSNGSTLLHFAAKNGDLSLVQQLLESGAQINAVDRDNNTPLNLAASAGKTEVVKFLLSKDANCNFADKKNCTPLYHAILSGNQPMFKALREKGAEIISFFENNGRLLYRAALCGDLEMMAYVLKLGMDRNAKTNAMMIAIEKNHSEIVKLLLAEKFPPADQEKFLFEAITHGNLEPLKLLIQSGFPFKSILGTRFYTIKDKKIHNGVLPLHVAAMNGHLAMVQYLIENGADVNAKNNPEEGITALVLAAQYGHKHVFDFLVQCNAPIFSSTLKALSPTSEFAQLKKALYYAMTNNHQAILDSILAVDKTLINQTFPYEIGMFATPLYFAVEKNDQALVEYCLSYGAKMDDQLLHFAVDKGNNEIVKLLLENCDPSERKAKLNVSLSDSYIKSNGKFLLSDVGYKPLHIAMTRLRFDIVKTLLANGIHVDQLTEQSQCTPLFLAVKNAPYNELNLLKFLISCGANVNAANTDGETPLSVAIRKSDMNIIQLLIESGATLNLNCYQALNKIFNVNTTNAQICFRYLISKGLQINTPIENGNTLLHFAVVNQNLSNVNFLLQNGANVSAVNADGKKPSDFIKDGLVLSRLKLAEYKKKLNDKALAQQQMLVQEQDLNSTLPSTTKAFSLFGIKIKKEKNKPKVSLQSKLLAVSALEEVYFQHQQNDLTNYSDIFKKSKHCKKLKKEIEKEVSKHEKNRLKNSMY